jgi:hypothetical protein
MTQPADWLRHDRPCWLRCGGGLPVLRSARLPGGRRHGPVVGAAHSPATPRSDGVGRSTAPASASACEGLSGSRADAAPRTASVPWPLRWIPEDCLWLLQAAAKAVISCSMAMCYRGEISLVGAVGRRGRSVHQARSAPSGGGGRQCSTTGGATPRPSVSAFAGPEYRIICGKTMSAFTVPQHPFLNVLDQERKTS